MRNFFKLIQIKRSNKYQSIHLLLPLFTVLTFFGPGFQSISIIACLWFPVAIYYSRNLSSWWGYIPFYFVNSIGTTLAFLGIWNKGNSNWSLRTFGYSILLGLSMNCISLVSLILDRFAQMFFRGWAKFMVFPCAWTALWNIFISVPFFGDLTNYAFIFFGFDEVMQFASFAGLGGINFILSWHGPVGVYIYKKWIHKKILLARDLESLNINKARKENRRPLSNPMLIYLLVLYITIGYGSFRISTSYIPFYQQNIETFAKPEFTKVGCVFKAENQTISHYIEKTRDLASVGTKFILWSEQLITVDHTELVDLTQSLVNISLSYNVYIGFTYLDKTDEKKRYSKLVVFSSNGELLINYAKTHLFPFTNDDNIISGSGILQAEMTPDFGIISGAIGFDYDFPRLIHQASIKNVNFMLDTSSTSTIENGFTLFRCNHLGISGVWNSYGMPYAAVQTLQDITITFQIPINKRVKTVYGIFGETWGWICVALPRIN
ncbi:2408_t:CDS:2 [Diversispora eburnea]|uniref:2408_t:CDS:1 n=1 Tax=Diversispora eburnea TaxID=1213867 RepID=A0A9N8VD60_9GLOM|nr:2408_t:CDS:2 [Diversispora eburnea]